MTTQKQTQPPVKFDAFRENADPAAEAARRAYWADHWKKNPNAAELYDED